MECKLYITLYIVRIICSFSLSFYIYIFRKIFFRTEWSKLSSNLQRIDELWIVEQMEPPSFHFRCTVKLIRSNHFHVYTRGKSQLSGLLLPIHESRNVSIDLPLSMARDKMSFLEICKFYLSFSSYQRDAESKSIFNT